MATDQEPKIADDGVQEVSLSIARPLLTRLIEQTREDDLVSALTVRDRRRAYLVAPAFYERDRERAAAIAEVRAVFKEDRGLAEQFSAYAPDLYEHITSGDI